MVKIISQPKGQPDSEGVKFALSVSGVLAIVAPVCAVLIGNPALLVGLFTVSCTVIAWLVAQSMPGLSKWVLGLCLLGQTMAITAVFRGHPWQIDTHMIYFATLAVIAVMYDARVLVAAAGLIAVHHLGMSFLMPTYLYPEMTDGIVLRTMMHAAIVVMETSILALSIRDRQLMDDDLVAQRKAVEAASAESKSAEIAAHRDQQEAAKVVGILSSHLKTLTDHDFSSLIEEKLPPQYDQMRLNFNALVLKLRDVLRTSSETAADFKVSSRELSGAANDLAKRTEQQSATLSQTADSLQDLTQTLQETAGGAGRANETASKARDSAMQNESIVKDAVEAMKKIEESSGEISNIINMIEDISFQTNLLALNAGVEAARAGNSGRGFAVVASEVRALAQRTSDAAQSVKQLIVKSSREVESGSSLVNSAGRALSDIVDQVSQASTMIGNITTSVNGQAGVVRDLNDAVQSLDQATQHNAAMCEEMTAMGHQLAQGSGGLSDALSRFRFGDDQRFGQVG